MRSSATFLSVLLAVVAGSGPTAAGSGPTAAGSGPTAASPPSAPELDWQVVSERPHDADAFTQGLELDAGRLFESTGLLGRSSVREVDPATGAVLRSEALPDHAFGEGLTLVDDRLLQLTWRNGVALTWDAETLARVGSHRYDGEGWGLCFDGARLVMSDGSDQLTFRDAGTFEVLGSVAVTHDGAPVHELNELECVAGEVWANVWMSDRIVRVDPADGRVTGWLDLGGLLDPHPAVADPRAVMNGIAYDEAAGTFLVTGKLWPAMFEIRVMEPD